MNIKKIKEKYLCTITIIVVVIAICAIALACKNYKDYETVKKNKYNMAFFEVVDYMENVESYLAKSLITKEAAASSENLILVWRETNLAGSFLAQIPVSTEGLSKTQKFLNQASEYTYSLFRKNAKGDNLTDEELDKLNELHDYSMEVKNTLNQLSEDINAERLNWDDLDFNVSTMFEKETSNISKDGFDTIEHNFEQYDGLIYDGAYSEHIINDAQKGLTGNDINEDEAMKIAEEFVKNNNISEVTSGGLSQNGNIECYSFNVVLNNQEKSNMEIAISKKGGHIVFTNYNRTIGEEVISDEDADNYAKKFLETEDYKNLEKTYYTKQAGIMTINYAAMQDDVIIYPDLIKVKVALDNGDILGIETTGYLNNHENRNLSTANIISKEKAKVNINKNIKIEGERLAVIPTEFKTEIFCWEFRGKVNDRDFLIYVNVKTGKIENILVITDTGNGILAM